MRYEKMSRLTLAFLNVVKRIEEWCNINLDYIDDDNVVYRLLNLEDFGETWIYDVRDHKVKIVCASNEENKVKEVICDTSTIPFKLDREIENKNLYYGRYNELIDEYGNLCFDIEIKVLMENWETIKKDFPESLENVMRIESFKA